ncbi:MAG: SIMPL domain-containing protein [Candidatus Diapherotrites archaeon]|nr:SIMPL domain-containing protein [Candidatus Diapherotrites archaeon]
MENKFFGMPLAIILAALIVAAGVLVSAPATQTGSDPVISLAAGDQPQRLINVSATAQVSAAPDQVELVFAVETDAKTAQESQQKNAETSAKVRAGLQALGIRENEIETMDYSLNEQNEYDPTTGKSRSTGYRTTHSLKVTLKNTGLAGKVIDAAVKAGANRVSSVQFTLSDAEKEELRQKALLEAAQTAGNKAGIVARGLGVQLGQLASASESSDYSYPQPYYANTYAKVGIAEADSAPTEFSPGAIRMSATVSASFEIR